MNETIYLTLILFIILGILFFIIENHFSNGSESFLSKKSLRKTRTAFRRVFIPRPRVPPPPRPPPYVPYNILGTYDGRSIMRDYGLPINIQSNQPCTFDEQCSSSIGFRSRSKRYCLAHHGSTGVCVTEDGCRNNQKNRNGYENTSSCKGVTFGNIYVNTKHKLNHNISRDIDTSTGWSKISSKLEISSPSVPPIPSLQSLKNRVRNDFEQKLPADIKDIFNTFSLPSRPVNNTYFIDYTNYTRNKRGLTWMKWENDSRDREKNYNNNLSAFNQETSKWIQIKFYQKKLNELLTIVENNHRSDNAKRDVVVEWYKKYAIRNKLIDLEKREVSNFEKKIFMDPDEIRRREERQARLDELKKTLAKNMEKWRAELNDALFKDDIKLKEDLDKLGDEIENELNIFQNGLKNCYHSNAVCKLKSSINVIRNTKETEMVKPHMQNKMTENQNQPHITGANINYGNVFKEMKMKREEASQKRKEKLDKIEKWYNLKKENLEELKFKGIEKEKEDLIKKQESILENIETKENELKEINDSVSSKSLTMAEIREIQQQKKKINDNIQELEKEYEKKQQNSDQYINEIKDEFLIIMQQTEDVKDEFIAKVYSEY